MEMSPHEAGDSTSFLTRLSLFFLVLLLLLAIDNPGRNFRDFTRAVSAPLLMSARANMNRSRTGKGKKKLYITFDDGPNRGTRNVMRIVQAEGVPVSFFLVGERVFASSMQTSLWDSLKMMQLVELCNHSYWHAHNHYAAYYKAPKSVVSDFRKTQDTLQLSSPIARTPGRNIWRIDALKITDQKKSTATADSLEKAGFVLMGWDLEWCFNHKTKDVTATAETMVAAIDSLFKHNCTRKKDNLVLLAHDMVYQKSEDSFQLRQLFQLLKKRDDYEFTLVSQYPGADKQKDSIKRQPLQ